MRVFRSFGSNGVPFIDENLAVMFSRKSMASGDDIHFMSFASRSFWLLNRDMLSNAVMAEWISESLKRQNYILKHSCAPNHGLLHVDR